MKATMMYAAKRALFAAFEAQTGPAEPLEGVQIAYSYPFRDMTRKCIYGGGIRSTQDQQTGGVAEFRVVIQETITIGVYIRVLRVDSSTAAVADADDDVEAISDAISAILGTRNLAGNLTWLGIEGGMADYAETPDGPESIMSLQVQVQALLT